MTIASVVVRSYGLSSNWLGHSQLQLYSMELLSSTHCIYHISVIDPITYNIALVDDSVQLLRHLHEIGARFIHVRHEVIQLEGKQLGLGVRSMELKGMLHG